jgi:hypothetical protein
MGTGKLPGRDIAGGAKMTLTIIFLRKRLRVLPIARIKSIMLFVGKIVGLQVAKNII